MTSQSLASREVCQILRDIALGTRSIQRIGAEVQPGIPAAVIRMEVDGWVLDLYTEGTALAHCESCFAPDGRSASCADWHRPGTDPVELLSTWERAQIEGMLDGL